MRAGLGHVSVPPEVGVSGRSKRRTRLAKVRLDWHVNSHYLHQNVQAIHASSATARMALFTALRILSDANKASNRKSTPRPPIQCATKRVADPRANHVMTAATEIESATSR